MARVSNLPGGGAGGAGVVCRPAAAAEIRPALSLILGGGGRFAGENQVGDFVRFAQQRGIDLARLSVAESSGRLLWAVLPIPSPGRTLLVLAPAQFLDPAQVDAAGKLTQDVCATYARRDVHLAQVLLDPADANVRDLYQDMGFVEMAELIYLHATTQRLARKPKLPAGFDWLPYSPHTHAMFARAIVESYEESLDCPRLNGLRDMEDVIAGHKSAAGEFDPALWLVLVERTGAVNAPALDAGAPAGAGEAAGEAAGGELAEGAGLSEAGAPETGLSSDAPVIPRGVLLLGRTPSTDGMELVYLGLCPEIRSRGLGSLMMQQAMAIVSAGGRRRLTLAVDSRNEPALKLYYRHGMQRAGTKVAMLRDLRTPPKLVSTGQATLPG